MRTTHRILVTIAVLLIVVAAAATVVLLPALPSRVPIHFDLSGRANGTSGRLALLTLPAFAILSLALLFVGRTFAHRTDLWTPTDETLFRGLRSEDQSEAISRVSTIFEIGRAHV